jgi:hypothetical protein
MQKRCKKNCTFAPFKKSPFLMKIKREKYKNRVITHSLIVL